MINNKYPTLHQLFGCYFHQDWTEEFDSPDKAIEGFLKSEPVECKKAKQELITIIESNDDNDSISKLLNELGCYYDYMADYSSAIDWLKYIKKILDSWGFLKENIE